MSRTAFLPRELCVAPFRGADAIARGLVTRRQLAGAAWQRLLPDIYVRAGVPLDHRVLCHAAGLYVAGRGAVSGRSAAYLWGVDVLRRSAPVEVTVPVQARVRSLPGLSVVRSALPAGDLARLPEGVVTSPVRTACDLARRLPLVDAVVAVDAMLAARLVNPRGLAAAVAAHGYWPGVRQARLALRLTDSGAASPMESRLRLVLVGGGLPRPVTQYEVRDRAGLFVARLDLAYPRRRLGIEYEGDHHRGRGVFQQDLRRLNALRACGWTVLRFAALDIYRDPGRIVATVRAALAS